MNANFECRFPYVLLESPRGLGSVLLGCGCQEYKHVTYKYFNHRKIWVRPRRCGCLVTWFCYQLIAKPGNKTAALPWPDPYICCDCFIFARSIIHLYSNFIIIMTAICKTLVCNLVAVIKTSNIYKEKLHFVRMTRNQTSENHTWNISRNATCCFKYLSIMPIAVNL